MLKFTDPASIAKALTDPRLDPDLIALVRCLALDLSDGSALNIIVVQGGDTPAVINDAVGHPITGDGAEVPSYDWIKDHDGRWFEIALSPIDGVPTRVFVENGPGTELGLHYLCLSYFWPDGEGGDR